MSRFPDFPSDESEEDAPNPADIIDRIINGGDEPTPVGD